MKFCAIFRFRWTYFQLCTTFRAEFMSTKMFRRGFLIAISFRREGYNNNNNNNNQGFLGLPQGVWKSEFPVGKSFLLRGTEKKTQTLKWSGKKPNGRRQNNIANMLRAFCENILGREVSPAKMFLDAKTILGQK